MRKWPESLVAAVKAELAGNARRDLLGWAHRTVDANTAGRAISTEDLDRARLVLAIESGAV